MNKAHKLIALTALFISAALSLDMASVSALSCAGRGTILGNYYSSDVVFAGEIQETTFDNNGINAEVEFNVLASFKGAQAENDNITIYYRAWDSHPAILSQEDNERVLVFANTNEGNLEAHSCSATGVYNQNYAQEFGYSTRAELSSELFGLKAQNVEQEALKQEISLIKEAQKDFNNELRATQTATVLLISIALFLVVHKRLQKPKN